MGYKVFASYKYKDDNVKFLLSAFMDITTVRHYVNEFEKKLGEHIYKGEHDDEDLSHKSEKYIEEKLKDKIYDSSITVLFISPGMRENKLEEDQWIPWEIEYSLREKTRNDRTSHGNAILGVRLPSRDGRYDYPSCMGAFNIVTSNVLNGYIEIVNWPDFMENITGYLDKAVKNKEKTADGKVVKTFKKIYNPRILRGVL